MQSLLTLQDLYSETIEKILLDAVSMKMMKNSPDWQKSWNNCLSNKNIVLYFEKPSLRTHLTFDIAVKKVSIGNSITSIRKIQKINFR